MPLGFKVGAKIGVMSIDELIEKRFTRPIVLVGGASAMRAETDVDARIRAGCQGNTAFHLIKKVLGRTQNAALCGALSLAQSARTLRSCSIGNLQNRSPQKSRTYAVWWDATTQLCWPTTSHNEQIEPTAMRRSFSALWCLACGAFDLSKIVKRKEWLRCSLETGRLTAASTRTDSTSGRRQVA